MSVRMALAKLCACTCGGALIGGGAVHVTEAPAAPYVKKAPKKKIRGRVLKRGASARKVKRTRRTVTTKTVTACAPSVVTIAQAPAAQQPIPLPPPPYYPAPLPEIPVLESGGGSVPVVIGGSGGGGGGFGGGFFGGFFGGGGGSGGGGGTVVISSTSSGGSTSTSTGGSSTSGGSTSTSTGGFSSTGGSTSTSTGGFSSTSTGGSTSTSSGSISSSTAVSALLQAVFQHHLAGSARQPEVFQPQRVVFRLRPAVLARQPAEVAVLHPLVRLAAQAAHLRVQAQVVDPTAVTVRPENQVGHPVMVEAVDQTALQEALVHPEVPVLRVAQDLRVHRAALQEVQALQAVVVLTEARVLRAAAGLQDQAVRRRLPVQPAGLQALVAADQVRPALQPVRRLVPLPVRAAAVQRVGRLAALTYRHRQSSCSLAQQQRQYLPVAARRPSRKLKPKRHRQENSRSGWSNPAAFLWI